MINVGTLLAILRMKDEFSQQLQKASRDMERVGARMKTIGTNMLPLSIAVASLGAAALKMSNDFNKGMANVATLIPGNIARVQQFKGAVQGRRARAS